MSVPAKPPRRRQHDQSEMPVYFLPEGNRAAKWAYVCTLIGFLPGLGLLFGLPAFVLGMIGLRIARRDEQKRGIGHAWVSRLVGGAEVVCGAAGFWCLRRAYFS